MKMKEMNTHKLLSTVLSLVVSVGLSAQMSVGVGQWKTHLSYNATTNIALANERVYAVSEGSLYSVGKEDNSVQIYSKVTGLSDIQIEKIFYIAEKQMLFASYGNGNIDFVADDGSVVNLSDIYNKNITADKKVNDQLYYDSYLYLAMPFGIVKVDVSRNEIADTYYFKDTDGMYINALSIGIVGDSLFVTAPDRILKAPAKGKNLANFANWQKITNLPSGKNTKSVVFESKIYLLQESGEVSVLSNGVWTSGVYSDVREINVSNGLLFVIKENTIEFPQKVMFDFQPQMAAFDSQSSTIWLAASGNGVCKIRRDNLNDRSFYKPNGTPSTNSIWRIRPAGNRMIAVAGGRWDVPYGTPADAMIYENGQWTNISQGEIMYRLGVKAYDFVDIAADAADPQHFFIGSWGTGLFEFRQDRPYHWYHQGNSGLQSGVVGNVVFDRQKRLWLANPATSSLIKYAQPNGSEEYTIFPVASTSLQSVWTTSDLLIDNTDPKYKYLVVTRGQVKFMAINDKGTDDSGDDEVFTASQFLDQDNRTFRAEHYMCGVQDKITGSLWIGTTSGPVVLPNPRNVFNSNYRCHRVKIARNNGTDEADYMLANEVISTIAIDGNNRKWIGTEGSGAYLLSEDGTETILHFTTDNSPILSNWIRTIGVNPQTGEVFFGTNKGLISYQGDASEATEEYENLHAFPNPVRPNYHGDITIKGLAENSVVKITDIRGNLVFETFVKGGMAVWHGKGIDGKRVASGVYLAVCNTSDGSKHGVVKILVIN